ncbi:MAG: FecR domain-containing protein [Pseudomonadota bacterium]|nr:FecR domain-containing protein [Pseudomonadota bacterium]
MRRRRPRAVMLALGLVLVGHVVPSVAQAPCDQWAARLVSVEGQVELKTDADAAPVQVRRDRLLCPGGSLHIGANSRAAIVLPSDTMVRLNQRTSITFPEPESEETSVVELIKGLGYFLSRVPRMLKIKTPFVNAAVEGTEFLVHAAPSKESGVAVFEGLVRVANQAGELRLASGEAAVAGPDQAPQKVLIARPRDQVEWALYYPPVTEYRPQDVPTEIRGAIDQFNRGDVPGALASLDQVPPKRRSAEFYALRASILLYVGQVIPARRDLDEALKRDSANGTALALQSIVALVLNRPEEAERLAKKGADLSAKAAAPRIALSYLYQSRFNLDRARKSAQSATELEVDNALAWARLAELDLALGNLDGARTAAEQSTTLNPDLSRTQTTLGFAQLLRFDADNAADSFERAIALDQSDPLPRLGLGISMIQRGRRNEGRREIEIAATLDPGTSIIRSYLGKAYYDEKRDAWAGIEYKRAKELDPNDPTPWFYDAIRKQTDNRPVEALEEIERSIALNDNRAVYRSSLALDSDLAARSASQARIYGDLGFEQLALVEGWTSVNESPANFSAHRFLADAYAAKPRFEVARTSEFLQSQLWQPLNLNPIQPQLAQSNLGIIRTAGPTLVGPNEYNPLFARDGVQLQASLLVGGDETFADDLALSAVSGIYSLGLGQFHFETDGFRPNADQTQDLYNLFFQVSPSPRASLQLEYRRYEADLGDTVLRFDPENFSTALRFERTSDTLRLGGRYEFSPRSKLIGSVIGEDSDFSKRDVDERPPAFTFDAETESRSLSTELQHVYEGESFNLISGLGYLTVKPEIKGEITLALFPPPFPPLVFPIDDDDDFRNAKAYLYSAYALNDALTLQAGANLNDCKTPFRERSQFDPKLGLVWEATHGTQVRAAAFQTTRCVGSDPAEPALALPQPENQTIEPTQVAGFNQLFDDSSGSESDVFGVALDHKFSTRLFAGGSFTRRDIKVPFLIFDVAEDVKWREDVGQAYLNWALDRNWAFSVAYDYEKLDYGDKFFVNGASKLTTQRVPISLRFFSHGGLSAGVTSTFVDQDIDLFDTLTGISEDDGDSFWLVDAALVYRLPKRYGFLSLEAKNLLNEEFRFQEPDPNVPTLYPDRLLLAKLNLYFY